MATITKSAQASVSTVNVPAANKLSGLIAGEDIAALDSCYIKSDGKVWKSNGTSANAAALCDGFAAVKAKAGEAVTLVRGVNAHYGASLTPGARLYVSATAGALDDAATTGGTVPVAVVIDSTRIYILHPTR